MRKSRHAKLRRHNGNCYEHPTSFPVIEETLGLAWRHGASSLLIVIMSLLVSPSGIAQSSSADFNKLGVDSVKLDNGKRLWGFALAVKPDRTLTFSADRALLKQSHPQLAAELAKAEAERFKSSQTRRLERIEAWLNQRSEDRGLAAFLNHELQRIEGLTVEDLDKKKFLTVDLPANRYRDLMHQPADRRQIAGLAYQYDLEMVAVTVVTQLKKQLVELGADIEVEKVDLSKHVVATLDDDRQWAARQAIVEHSLRAQIEFQGTGAVLIRRSAEPDLNAVVSQLVSGADPISQIGAELGLPEFSKARTPTDWWRKATEEAERDGFRGVSIIRMNQNALSDVVRVDAHFFAMHQPGNWFEVVQFQAEANAAEQTAEQTARLKDDPQVKAILDTLNGLGLGDTALLDKSLRHGAAAQKAMQNASGQLNAFLTSHSRELDTQPIQLP